MRTSRILLCGLAAAAVLLSAMPPLRACGGCDEMWYVYTAITTPVITNPIQSSNGCGIGAEVSFTCSACTDQDRHDKADCTIEYPWDTATYTWTATGGTFPQGNTGRTVVWKAPAAPGNYTLTVTVNDVDGHTPGTDNDSPKTASRTMQVIRLKKLQLYFHREGTAYPYTGQPIETRAVATVVYPAGTEKDYCGLSMNPALWAWWCPGSDEFRGENVPPHEPADPEPYYPQDGTIYTWPSNWPHLYIEWRLLWHHGSDPDGNSNRVYSYDDEAYLTDSWGEDNRVYSSPITHRLRATAKLHPGAAWQQTRASTDFNDDGQPDGDEKALRICPRRDITTAGSAMREHYVEWISTFEEEPYEWGGEGYGGKDSRGQYAGGNGSYEDYGIDCSGLVSCGAHRTAYNWDYPPPGPPITWRVDCAALIGDYCSDPVSYDDFDEGDILVRHDADESHVVSCSYRYPSPDEHKTRIIHAGGGHAKVLQEETTIESWTNDGYSRRRLEPH